MREKTKGEHVATKSGLLKDVRLSIFAAVLSVINLLLFHYPFFSYGCENVEKGLNGYIIIVCLVILMLVLNYFAFYLILYLGRFVGKLLMAFFFVGNSIGFYFITTYDIMIDDSMMGNVFNTNYSEATSYWSVSALLYILLMGVLPCILIFAVKLKYGTLKQFFANTGYALLIAVVIGFANMSNWTWVDNNSTVGGSLVLPWSYVINTFRYQNSVREANRQEILLPDATIADDDKAVMVLVIGESARRDHFSLYGYGRNTNPRLSQIAGLKAYKANSSATYTTAGVKAILEYKDTGDLYEILPNYLFRTGVDVIWRSSNWGQPPLHIDKYLTSGDLGRQYDMDKNLDESLLPGLKETVSESECGKVLIVLHTSTSHGPSYATRYPAEFEVFKPVSTSVEMSKCPQDQLMNAYDNTIVYTDYLLSSIIDTLSTLDDWKSCMMYVSDHGESLGEKNLYMHGVPMSIAPAEQYEIPFIVWKSDGGDGYKPYELIGQHHVFHSVLHFLGIDSPVYNEEMNIFE